MKAKLPLLIVLILLVVQCKTTSTIPENMDAAADFTPTIMTVILRETRGEKTLEVEHIIHAKGWLKEDYGSAVAEVKEGWYCFSFLDKAGNIRKQTQLQSNLTQRYEAAEEDGTIESVVVEKETEVLNLRTNADGTLVSLKVERMLNGTLQTLQTIPLK